MLDVADLATIYSVADYQQGAYQAIDGIAQRRRQPLLVGGSGLYVDAVTAGYMLTPVAPNPSHRAASEHRSLVELGARLRELDPIASSHIDLTNRRRVIRALEIAETGIRYSDTRRRYPKYEVLKLGLTWPPDVLRTRIRERLLRRMRQGMVEEVRRLLATGVPTARLDGLGLEYRHVLRFLLGEYTSEEEMLAELERGIRRFARRQLAWFRRDPHIVWLDTQGSYGEEAMELANGFLSGAAAA